MKPLLITDCDEVLLHMVRHFGSWLDEAHDIAFRLNGAEFTNSMQRRGSKDYLAPDEMWALLDGFFPEQMHRQTLVPHAREALTAIAEAADVVVLTNLRDHCRDHRIEQLAQHGIVHRVECNQGGKGARVASLIEELRPSVAVFVDDLPVHHASVAEHAPDVFRLHMVAEPELAPRVPAAVHAHARIDDWQAAQRWIAARFAAGLTATAVDGSAVA
jgi:hypothetical protein